MKILVVTDNLPDQVNGVVTTFRNLAAEAEKDGAEIIFLHPGMFRHFSCPGYPEVKLALPFGAGKVIEEINPDYLHIVTEGPLGFAARIWCYRNKKQYNTSYHTKFPEYMKKLYGVPEFFTYAYVRWFHRDSKKVLTTTKSMVDALYRRGFVCEVIPWTRGVNLSVLSPTVKHRRHDRSPIVLYVGRVSKEKGLDDLCRLSNDYEVRIVGDGPYRKHLEKKYKKVKFLGYQKGTDLANQYVQADVFCFPSQTDTFGIVIIEAMSLGLPVAGYPVSGPADLIEEGITGYVSWDLKSAIDRCLHLDREEIKQKNKDWTWRECWTIFKDNLSPFSP